MKVLKRGEIVISNSNLTESIAAYDATKSYVINDEVLFNKYIYKALKANKGIAPQDTTSTEWQKVRVSNEWAAFDYFLNTISSAQDSISITFACENAKGVYIHNILANTLKIEVLDATAATIMESQEFRLMDTNSSVISWQSYFFGGWKSEVRPKSIFYECTTLANHRIFRITATRAGGEVQIGSIIAGDIIELETTLYNNNSISMLDYSKVTTDEDGNTALTKGNYKRTNSFQILVRDDKLDYIAYELAQLRGEACVFIIATKFECLINFAFLKNHELMLEKVGYSIVEIEIEGLV